MENNDLLEQWRKEADKVALNMLINDECILYEDVVLGYIEGCKATHEKMQKGLEDLQDEINRLTNILSNNDLL